MERGVHPPSGGQKLIAEAYNSVIQLPVLNRMIISTINEKVHSPLSLSSMNMTKMT